MTWDVETTTKPVARKDYDCQAAEWIDNTIGWNELEFEESDREILRKAKAEGCKILKGTKYIKTTGIWEGEFDTFRARIDLDYICQKYELYQE